MPDIAGEETAPLCSCLKSSRYKGGMKHTCNGLAVASIAGFCRSPTLGWFRLLSLTEVWPMKYSVLAGDYFAFSSENSSIRSVMERQMMAGLSASSPIPHAKAPSVSAENT